MGVLTNNDIRVCQVILLQMLISAVTSSASVKASLLPFIGTFVP